jgi:predicted HTH domain antitoxin
MEGARPPDPRSLMELSAFQDCGLSNVCYPQTMQITVQLPEDLIEHPNPGREALEALAIEGYRVGTLSHYQASQLLGLSRFEFDGFLKGRHIYDHAYDLDDLEEDRETLQQLQAKGLLRGWSL